MNEKGTEAAAFTGSPINVDKDRPRNWFLHPEFKADKLVLFLICDGKTGRSSSSAESKIRSLKEQAVSVCHLHRLG